MVSAGPTSLRIATRGSELALWQARAVDSALREADPSLTVEVRVVRTTGDRIQDVPLAKIGDKGLFTKELDAALLAREAELAVHSLKDVPTRLPAGPTVAAVSRREDPRDVVLMRPGLPGGFDRLGAGARVGTSSLRRRAQLRASRPELQVDDLRGNLNTRLARLDRGDFDAIILAAAGVIRLGWAERIGGWLDPADWLPAVGQGALAVVARTDDHEAIRRVQFLHHPDSAAATSAERALLKALEGGCQIPIGALAQVHDGTLTLRGLVADLDGERVLRVEVSGRAADAEAIGARAASELLQRGAGEILAKIRSEASAVPAPPAP